MDLFGRDRRSRREVLKLGLALGGASLLRPGSARGDERARPQAQVGAGRSARVVIAREARLTVRQAKAAVLGGMLDRGVGALFGGPAREVWRELVRPEDVVGIKVNGLSGRRMSTRPALVDALVERIAEAGVPRRRIVIWDRLSADLTQAGFPVNVGGDEVQCYGNDRGGYEERLTMYRSIASMLARTLTERCSVVINVPVLKDHGICGVTLALKSFFGAIHNPNKYHINHGNPYIADLNGLPVIRTRRVLTVGDGILAQCEGGPPFMPQWTWEYGGLLFATDPVAMDAVGWSVLEAERKRRGLPTLREAKREPVYIATAAGLGLGAADSDQIEVKTV